MAAVANNAAPPTTAALLDTFVYSPPGTLPQAARTTLSSMPPLIAQAITAPGVNIRAISASQIAAQLVEQGIPQSFIMEEYPNECFAVIKTTYSHVRRANDNAQAASASASAATSTPTPVPVVTSVSHVDATSTSAPAVPHINSAPTPSVSAQSTSVIQVDQATTAAEAKRADSLPAVDALTLASPTPSTRSTGVSFGAVIGSVSPPTTATSTPGQIASASTSTSPPSASEPLAAAATEVPPPAEPAQPRKRKRRSFADVIPRGTGRMTAGKMRAMGLFVDEPPVTANANSNSNVAPARSASPSAQASTSSGSGSATPTAHSPTLAKRPGAGSTRRRSSLSGSPTNALPSPIVASKSASSDDTVASPVGVGASLGLGLETVQESPPPAAAPTTTMEEDITPTASPSKVPLPPSTNKRGKARGAPAKPKAQPKRRASAVSKEAAIASEDAAAEGMDVDSAAGTGAGTGADAASAEPTVKRKTQSRKHSRVSVVEKVAIAAPAVKEEPAAEDMSMDVDNAAKATTAAEIQPTNSIVVAESQPTTLVPTPTPNKKRKASKKALHVLLSEAAELMEVDSKEGLDEALHGPKRREPWEYLSAPSRPSSLRRGASSNGPVPKARPTRTSGRRKSAVKGLDAEDDDYNQGATMELDVVEPDVKPAAPVASSSTPASITNGNQPAPVIIPAPAPAPASPTRDPPPSASTEPDSPTKRILPKLIIPSAKLAQLREHAASGSYSAMSASGSDASSSSDDDGDGSDDDRAKRRKVEKVLPKPPPTDSDEDEFEASFMRPRRFG